MPALLQGCRWCKTCLPCCKAGHLFAAHPISEDPRVLQVLKCCSSVDRRVICLLPHMQRRTAEHITCMRCRRALQCLDLVWQATHTWLLLLESLQVVLNMPGLLQR